jgi:hypothetical protein
LSLGNAKTAGGKSTKALSGGDMTLDSELVRDLRQVICELELVSHVSAIDYAGKEGGRSSEHPGGKRPPGGIDRREDRYRDLVPDDKTPERILRSADSFKERALRARSNYALETILAEAESALAAWRRSPSPRDESADYKGALAKRWIAESAESDAELARITPFKRKEIEEIRRQYGPVEVKIRRRPGCSVCGTMALAPQAVMCSACAEFAALRAEGGDPFEEVENILR